MGRARARAAPGAALLAALLALGLAACRGGSRPAGDAARDDTTGASRMSRPPLAEVLARHTTGLLAVPGVVGTGEGAEQGDPVFVIFVIRDTPDLRSRLPRALEGYRTVVRESGKVRAR